MLGSAGLVQCSELQINMLLVVAGASSGCECCTTRLHHVLGTSQIFERPEHYRNSCICWVQTMSSHAILDTPQPIAMPCNLDLAESSTTPPEVLGPKPSQPYTL